MCLRAELERIYIVMHERQTQFFFLERIACTDEKNEDESKDLEVNFVTFYLMMPLLLLC